MTSSEVIVPNLETLVQLKGSADFTVTNIHFSGINFKFTSWLRPSMAGNVPLQAGMYLLDGYHLEIPGTPDKKKIENQAWIGRQSAEVAITYARDLVFDRCTFRHMAATGIDFIARTSHDLVSGCSFKDIGGTAIQTVFLEVQILNLICRIIQQTKRNYFSTKILKIISLPKSAKTASMILKRRHMPTIQNITKYIYFDEGSSYICSRNNWTEVDKFSQIPRVPGMNRSTTNRRLPTALS